MKKFIGLTAAVIILVIFCLFNVSAAEYSFKDMKINVPDFLKNDADWAQSADHTFAFSDSDVNMELNISVYENEGYSYEGLDEDNLNDYAMFLRDQYENGDYSPLKNITVTSITTKQGVSGIMGDVIFEDEHYVLYWYATEENCYDFNFYFYNDEFLQYAHQIMETLIIGKETIVEPETTQSIEIEETLPTLSDDEVEADGDGRVEPDNKLNAIMIFPLPAIIFVVALVLLIVLLITKRNKKKEESQISEPAEGDGGLYFDPKTGNYYKTVAPGEEAQPGQPIGYIYYPVQGNTTQQDNNNSTQQ